MGKKILSVFKIIETKKYYLKEEKKMALFLLAGGEEFWHVLGSSGILVESRIPKYKMSLCSSACVGKPCYSNNPGCQLEEIISEMHFRHWNELLGLMDN